VKPWQKWLALGTVVLAAIAVVAGTAAYRTRRVIQLTKDIRSQVRYLIENGGTIGEAPSKETFSMDYLQPIFGDNPELLKKLKDVVQEGMAEEPALSLGEVAPMVVTYHMAETGTVEDVVVHAIGGFPLARSKPGFHRHGYFFYQINKNLWDVGNIFISFLGRDMVLFSAKDETTEAQQALIDSLFSGDITMLVGSLSRPLHYTAVLPDPRRIVPPQLRGHVQAVVLKGMLSPQKGALEGILLTPSVNSAGYAFSLLRDVKLAAELSLRTRWHGVVENTAWGPCIDTWWAWEMVRMLEKSPIEKEQNLIRIRAEYGRVMVNAVMKTIERMSRDLAQMRGSLEERLDPREVDARLATTKPGHYWSEAHQWGPDWPFPAPTNAGSTDVQAEVVATQQTTSASTAVP
jgi:hypothetical protein